MDQSLDRRRSARDWIVDSVAFAGSVLGAFILYDEGRADPVPNELLAFDFYAGMLLCLLLWFRRRWPVQLAVLTALLTTFSEAAGAPGLIITATVAIHMRFRVTMALLALNIPSLVAYALIRDKPEPLAVTVVMTMVIYTGVVGWGLYIRSRRQLLQTLRDRADRAETVAQLQAQQAQMRAREEIAREMHDVLGHRLSLLTVHAGALAYRSDASTEEVAGAAEIIRSSAHQALQDLREVIGVLRAPVGELPQPTFADLPALVDGSRQAGVPVELELDAPAGLPEHVGRTAYRIVQEGLTNALKHAPGQPVRIAVTGAPGNGLTVDITNPAPHRAPSGPGKGRGLTGLTERAVLVDGRLDHGRTPEGDFRLTAWLPWPA